MAAVMTFPYGEDVRVSTPTEAFTLDPYSRKRELSWADPTVTTYEKIPVEPRSGADSPSPGRPDHVVEGVTIALPYGAAVTSESRVEILTGPHAGVYEVDGEPGHWRNPFTGWAPACDVNLTRVKG